jgi:hypothetical protein
MHKVAFLALLAPIQAESAANQSGSSSTLDALEAARFGG